EALKQGKLDLAEAYNNQAKKVAWLVHFPLADTPSKVERDIAAARAKLAAASPASMANGSSTEKKESTGIVTQVKRIFSGKGDKKREGPMAADAAPVVRGPALPAPPPPL